MPPELRCVELNSISESEGMVFEGYAGDSGDCTSSEGSQIEWSNDNEKAVPLSGGLEEERALLNLALNNSCSSMYYYGGP